jgi:hypothetical protein
MAMLNNQRVIRTDVRVQQFDTAPPRWIAAPGWIFHNLSHQSPASPVGRCRTTQPWSLTGWYRVTISIHIQAHHLTTLTGIFSSYITVAASLSNGTIRTPIIPGNYWLPSQNRSMRWQHRIFTVPSEFGQASKEENLMFGSCRPSELSSSSPKLGI